MKFKKSAYISISVLIFSLLIIAGSCRNSTGKIPILYGESDWERMGLHGKVNSLKLYEVSWQENFGKISLKPNSVMDQSTVFLDTGNQSESTYYDTNGLPSWKDSFIYESDNETWLECISYKYLNADKNVSSPQWSYSNIYGNDNKLIKVEGYNYDAAGQKSASVSWLHTYEYLQDESKIVHSSYNSDGALQWRNISLYNTDALATESTQYNNNGDIEWRDKFKYDAQGNKIEWYRFDSDLSIQWKDLFKYDDKGNQIECASFDRSNKLMWKDVYHYTDEAGIANFDINKSSNNENKFDNNGNWTIRVTLEEKAGFGGQYLTIKEISIRDITYFP